jgi:hypothetical protein
MTIFCSQRDEDLEYLKLVDVNASHYVLERCEEDGTPLGERKTMHVENMREALWNKRIWKI